METGFMAIAFVAAAIAFMLGYLLGKAGKRSGSKGTIYIITDVRDGKAYPYLESNVQMEELASVSQAVFNIKTVHQDSHE